ncbi:MAG TPA: 16S rRNA (guanine(527)-N(7))-methyltransferase RsmG [Anaerolineae bacterium]|nr:16S rRNA (guanine(527)-N(7))-methyltransferase RsmG [Anaerolineae bacterium]
MTMNRLAEGGRRLGLSLTPAQLSTFGRYADQLLEWNQRFNLTAITDPEQVQVRHFLDSLSCLSALSAVSGEPPSRWLARSLQALDIGSGGGFPGLPLKIVWPNLRLVLLESRQKKVRFLEHIVADLHLTTVRALHGRAETMAREPEHRESYDLVFGRAVAGLPVLLEYALPFCRRGGLLLAQKGEAATAEAIASERALAILGGELRRIVPVEIPGLAETRHIMVVEKTAPTPDDYPRRPGMPGKRPL